MLNQRDTYFHALNGHLKLREEPGVRAQLIAYGRPSLPAQRESRYRIVELEDAKGVQAALEGALGVRGVVEKERRLFLWGGVRIHLDRVERLGHFVELEAVIADLVAPAGAEALLAQLRGELKIADGDLIGGSYCDLLPAEFSQRR